MIKVCHIDELPENSANVIMVQDTPVAVFNAGGKIFAWDNRCPHRGASLGDGYITDTTIQCKFHLWNFDITKACAVENEKVKINEFPIKLIGNEIYLLIDG